ncbi:hypothetical protein K466DRAFT_608015, partial [Polyporus arcularius HHB13444]
IAVSRRAYDRRKKAIKILLLGQAESGKSTTLKNFQLAFSPQHFHKERAAWKTIIQLNLIRSVPRSPFAPPISRGIVESPASSHCPVTSPLVFYALRIPTLRCCT